jgi:5-methyltetrahydropteroyltriglutamate--homocysteine methyltransferase
MASPYRSDHVGSLLRPPELIQARTDHAEGRISADQLRDAEDAAVLDALELQRQAGISVLSDGEYRRPAWSAAIRQAVEGLVPDAVQPTVNLLGAWRGPSSELANAALASPAGAQPMVVGAKLKQVRRIVGVDAAFLQQHAPGPWKITMPGPWSAAGQLYKTGLSDAFYPTRYDLVQELIGMQRREISALIEEGMSYFQLDSLHYVERIADTTIRPRMLQEGEDPDAYLDAQIAADNAVLAGLRRRDGLTVGLHMCRGNNRSAWHAEGSYEPIAEKAFSSLDVDRFLLEYDTDRAGGFEPLRFVPADKMVVLGLISSKLPELEPVDTLRRRIDEAAKYVPLERLAISPQCGFASTVLGNLMTRDEMRRKLDLVVETARAVWG